jgi:hypothetical protein
MSKREDAKCLQMVGRLSPLSFFLLKASPSNPFLHRLFALFPLAFHFCMSLRFRVTFHRDRFDSFRFTSLHFPLCCLVWHTMVFLSLQTFRAVARLLRDRFISASLLSQLSFASCRSSSCSFCLLISKLVASLRVYVPLFLVFFWPNFCNGRYHAFCLHSPTCHSYIFFAVQYTYFTPFF